MLTPMECEKLLGLEHSSADAPGTLRCFGLQHHGDALRTLGMGRFVSEPHEPYGIFKKLYT